MMYLVLGIIIWVLIGMIVARFMAKNNTNLGEFQEFTSEDKMSIVVVWPFILCAYLFIAIPVWTILYVKNAIIRGIKCLREKGKIR